MALEDYFQPFSRRDWERESVDGTVRMAVVGLGGFARNRGLPAIAAGEYCETTTLVSGSPEKAATLAEAFDVQHVVDYEAYKNGAAADAPTTRCTSRRRTRSTAVRQGRSRPGQTRHLREAPWTTTTERGNSSTSARRPA